MDSLEALPLQESIPLSVREQQTLDRYFDPLPETRDLGMDVYVKLFILVGLLALATNNPWLRSALRRLLGSETSSQKIHWISVGIMMVLFVLSLYILSKNNML